MVVRRDGVRAVRVGGVGGVIAAARGEFEWYWYQATDRKRHAYRGKARSAGATGARSICDREVEFSTAPYAKFYPSCWDCWCLIKELRGDYAPLAKLVDNRPRNGKSRGQQS